MSAWMLRAKYLLQIETKYKSKFLDNPQYSLQTYIKEEKKFISKPEKYVWDHIKQIDYYQQGKDNESPGFKKSIFK